MFSFIKPQITLWFQLRMKYLRDNLYLFPVFILLLIGYAEYPHALHKVQKSNVLLGGEPLIIIILTLFGIMLSSRNVIKQFNHLRLFLKGAWIYLAILTSSLPAIFGWTGKPPGIPGVLVYPGPLSLLIFFAWVVELKYCTKDNFSKFASDFSNAILGGLWVFATVRYAQSPLCVLLGVLVTLIVLRRTRLQFLMLSLFAISILVVFLSMSEYYVRDKFITIFSPLDDPYGRGYTANQVRNTIAVSGWIGVESTLHLPNATNQYMLSSITESGGWLGLGTTVTLLAVMLALIYERLKRITTDWLRDYSIALLYMIVIVSAINVVANLGLTRAAGMGVPFVSHNWFLAVICGFLVGLAIQTPQLSGGMLSSRVGHIDEGKKYCCYMCGLFLSGPVNSAMIDKFDRVFCSIKCMRRAKNHQSYEYEAKGGEF